MKSFNDIVKSSNQERLKQRLNQAKKDKNFLKVITNLKISDELAMNNVSRLEECIQEHINCMKCKSLSQCKNEMKGFKQTPTVKYNQLYYDYVACEYHLRKEDDEAHLKYIYSYSMPKELERANFDNIDFDDNARFNVLKYIKYFVDNYEANSELKGAYIHGNYGCGKTFILAAMVSELAKKNIKCGLIYYPELLRSLKSNFKDDFNSRFMYLRNIEVLVLDDIGAENMTPWGRDEILGSILQYRLQQKLPTFFTSNLSIKELENHFAGYKNSLDGIKARRIIERIKTLTEPIELRSHNRRK